MLLNSHVAVALPTLTLGEDERNLVSYHLKRLSAFEVPNKLHEAYYEGRARLHNLGIAVPPELRDIENVVGWPGTAVDVLEERLDWQGWTSDNDNDFGLGDIYTANGLDLDSGLGHLDALIYGTAFVIVGSGYDDEPHPLITVESPRRVTGKWDGRLRRLSSALSLDEYDEKGDPTALTLYLPNENIYLDGSNGDWRVVERDQHNAGRVLVAQLVNRPRASRTEGRSEITRPVRAYTDQAVRTMLGMDVHREFYQAPQRYALGVDSGAFEDKDGNVKTGWEAVMGRMLALPRDEDGELPVVGQFAQTSPAPYLEQVRGLSQMLSAEAAIPATYMGFTTDNPPSADAIRAMEARLIKRAERRQTGFGRTWREVGGLALLVRDGRIPDEYHTTIGPKWRDAATPTRSAAADEATKLISAGVLPPDSSVTYDRIGLSPQEQRQVRSDRRRAAAQNRLSALAAAAQAAREDENVVSMEAFRGSDSE